MADTSQGPGWWLASDGKWYPPESHPVQAHPSRFFGRDPSKRPARIWGSSILVLLGLVQIITGSTKHNAAMVVLGIIAAIAGAGFLFLTLRRDSSKD